MTDIELLELAAKAAWIDYHATREDGTKCIHDGRGYWNPLTDDGDALRLAVKLREELSLLMPACFGIGRYKEWKDDPYAATRRAIVRAAAEIGKDMV
jgi:hypothetical protein